DISKAERRCSKGCLVCLCSLRLFSRSNVLPHFEPEASHHKQRRCQRDQSARKLTRIPRGQRALIRSSHQITLLVCVSPTSGVHGRTDEARHRCSLLTLEFKCL